MRIADSMVPTALHPSRHPHEYILLHHFPQLINHMMAMRTPFKHGCQKNQQILFIFLNSLSDTWKRIGLEIVHAGFLWVLGDRMLIIPVWWNFQPSPSLGRWNIFAFLLNVFCIQRQEHFKILPCKAKTLCVKNFCCSACRNIWKYENFWLFRILA